MTVVAIISCALYGCGPKIKFDAGTEMSATLWWISHDLMAKEITLRNDKAGQDALQKNKCELIVPIDWESEHSPRTLNKAIMSCDDQDLVEFPAQLFDAQGRAGFNPAAVGDKITIKLDAPITVKLAH